ncbi:MAG: 3-oxoacyl-[acyl-carrier-protein] reductase [Phycisphaeraceae bacterium]|nr:3-oxoacyl-[acyl-carrier-protein] reductase [Phycisphaerae bacterium]MBX3391716.1 3-oxoacyl-[acyl-carrier-protein] reductase [Phycisphaeraceae bacterium]HRJ49601.1 3-oxoacyl-[acyl-carrier-protein] reductase [Phycisphaerales bacterium]
MGQAVSQRVAIVTGASRGIGRATAQRLAADGRLVVLVARSEGPLGDLRSTIEADGGKAAVRAVDVADRAALAAMVESVAEEFGRIDILVNNAGITRDGLALRMSDEDWDLVLNTNLSSAFVAIRAAARSMMRGKFGRIVNIGSTSGVVGNAGQANYAAAKAGLAGLTKTIARELGSKGITCNLIAPGFIQTDMTDNLPPEVKEHVLSLMAVKRLGVAQDIADAVAYVTSDQAGYLTGQTICVDGGMTMC